MTILQRTKMLEDTRKRVESRTKRWYRGRDKSATGINWNKMTREILQKNPKCIVCEEKATKVKRVKPMNKGGKVGEKNTITLCEGHYKVFCRENIESMQVVGKWKKQERRKMESRKKLLKVGKDRMLQAMTR